jgi:cyclopropane fatty-acyl-phospholipid synthase-like methyltransferase
MKAPSAELIDNIHDHLRRNRGKLYTPIPHPAFADMPYRNGPERFELISPHLEYENGTVLDIGSNWGYMAHRLEECGYKVTAVERAPASVYFMREIRDLCGRKFEVIHDSVFNLTHLDYDIVLALNVFHHFMKTEKDFRQLETLLGRLKCRMLIYQAHDPNESQMSGAFCNMKPEEAAQYLSEKLSLPRIVEIGSHRKAMGFRKRFKDFIRNRSRPKRRRLFKIAE